MTEPSPTDPTQLGRYRVLGPLDPQPNFRLLLAAAPDDSLRVVEQSLPRLLELPELRPRLRHGAVAAMRVSGQGNATVLDVDADDELPWLARTFVPSVRLDRAVGEFGPLPVEAVRALAAALAFALRGVHAAGLVHQRVRPDTVGLTEDGIELAGIDVLAGDPTTLLAPPDYLSPEQSVHGALTAASDIFSLGSVLAYAAGGVAPFAAPSIPYTLFNIAQRDPDLSAVPEPLRELIAACLRRDPRARPSPAQIIAYVGARRQAWPSAIVDEIDRAERAAAALLAAAAPAFAEPVSSAQAGSVFEAVAGFGRDRWASLRGRVGGSSVRTRRVVAVAIVTAVVVSATLWLSRTADPVGAAQPTALSAAQLRQVDSCAWLRSALGDSVAWREGPSRTESWRFEVQKNWSCYADEQQQVYGDGIRLSLGVALTEVPPNHKLIEGITVREGDAEYCRRAIASSDSGGRTGILIEFDIGLAEKQGCAVADHVVAQLARTLHTAPRRPDAAISLASVDPCAILDRAETSAAVPRLTPEPSTPEDMHICEWYGSARVTLQVVRTSFVPVGSVTVDGLTLLTGKESSGSALGCSRIYRHRTIDEKTYEAMELVIQGPHVDRDSICRTVESLIVKAVRRLPEA
ncbi:protein kinase domain-containing protein [Nocardia sp. FBN12]|uniref:protein kinase domain-containing protein n=1 Tax=Nocardia sp. FBN12 TaxID=3419766 RepID=UPI003D001E7C